MIQMLMPMSRKTKMQKEKATKELAWIKKYLEEQITAHETNIYKMIMTLMSQKIANLMINPILMKQKT